MALSKFLYVSPNLSQLCLTGMADSLKTDLILLENFQILHTCAHSHTWVRTHTHTHSYIVCICYFGGTGSCELVNNKLKVVNELTPKSSTRSISSYQELF